MGRPSTYDSDQILDVAAALVCTGGPAALSITGIANRLGAPSGSIYHRFRSRDTLAASLWLRAVERFQSGYFEALDQDDSQTAVRRAASYVLSWSRENLDDARLLLLYRSSDLLQDGWPRALSERNELQRARITQAIDHLCTRLGTTTAMDRRRVVFAIIDLPYGAARTPLAAGEPPSTDLDAIVDDAVTAVIDGIGRRSPK